MEEYSISVFYLVQEAIKLEATERLDQIAVNAVPHLEEADAQRIISSYESRARDEVIDLERDDMAKEKLTNIFGG